MCLQRPTLTLMHTQLNLILTETCRPIDEPMLAEVATAIKKLRNGRTAGSDGVPPELLKGATGPVSLRVFIHTWQGLTDHSNLDLLLADQ